MYRNPTSAVVGLLGWLTKTPAYSYLCKGVTTTDIYKDNSTFITEKSLAYNDFHLLAEETSCNPANTVDMEVRTYKYVCDEPNLVCFSDRHILTPMREETFSSQGFSKKNFYDYLLNSSGVPFVSKYTSFVNGSPGKLEYEVTVTDKYGTPIEYWHDGVPYIQLLDNKGVNVTTKVENLQLSQLCDVVGKDKVSACLDKCNYEALAVLIYENRVPAAHYSFYRYTGDNMVLFEITPDGQKFMYDHDSSCRYIEKGQYRDNGKYYLMKVYEYNYAH